MKAMLEVPMRAGAAVLEGILASGRPALVVFETPECGPCQALRPLLSDLAREFRNRLLVVRVTDAGEGWLAARYHLVFVPTLLFYCGGREMARIAGNPGRPALREHVEYLLNGEVPPNPADGPRFTLLAPFGPARPETRSRSVHAH